MPGFDKPNRPFYIIVSKDDKALRASNFIAGGQVRLGANEDTAELAALGAIVVDMTDVEANDFANHGKFAELAELGPELDFPSLRVAVGELGGFGHLVGGRVRQAGQRLVRHQFLAERLVKERRSVGHAELLRPRFSVP